MEEVRARQTSQGFLKVISPKAFKVRTGRIQSNSNFSGKIKNTDLCVDNQVIDQK